MSMSFVTLAEQVSAFLSSPYKPFLVAATFIPFAWIASSKLEKDARYFHLNVPLWNTVWLSTLVAAMAAVLFIPIFWVGWPVAIILLVAPVLVYWKHRNARVPEARQFHLTGAGLAASMAKRREDKLVRDALIAIHDHAGKVRTAPSKEDPMAAVLIAAEDIVGPAVDARATAVDVQIGKAGCAVTQTVDGVRYKREGITPERALGAVDLFKSLAGLDVSDRRRRQVGAFSMKGPNGETKANLTTAGSSDGLVLRVEFNRAERLSRPFDNLGLLPQQLEALRTLAEIENRHGIVLVSAPAGHGLTTSMYSMLGRHDAYTANIKTLEREVMLELAGVDHQEWDPTNPDVDYATALQSILRRDPDVVMTDFVRDRETAKVVVDPGMQGPIIYVPVRAPSIGEAIRDFAQQVGDVKTAVKSLRAVTNQRLARQLCPQCKQAYQPSPEQLKKLGLPSGKVQQLHRPGGKIQVRNKIEPCPICQGTGYLGQVAFFEVMLVDGEVRKLLAAGDLKGAVAAARRNKMIYLQEAALAKAASGETSIEEIVRVTAPPKKVEAAA